MSRKCQITGKSAFGEDIPLYEKKDILMFNAEFLAEIHRVVRTSKNRYYLTKLCNNALRELVSTNRENSQVKLRNHTTSGKFITFANLFNATNTEPVATLLKSYNTIQQEYVSCARKMMQSQFIWSDSTNLTDLQKQKIQQQEEGRGIYTVRYTEHQECKGLTTAPDPTDDFILVKQGCMPVKLKSSMVNNQDAFMKKYSPDFDSSQGLQN